MLPYVPPHNKISRPVTEADIDKVLRDAEVMSALCEQKHGVHIKAYAIAHPQINDTDPLRFFVFHPGFAQNTIICNPKILLATDQEIKIEGCMSFPDKGQTEVPRSHKVTVAYQVFEWGKLVDKTATYANIKAQIFQHEIDHLNGNYIFSI